MFYQIFLSPQVKRCVTITYKHGIYKLPHKLLNNLRLGILGNKEISGKTSWNDSLVSSLDAEIKIFLILAKTSSKREIRLFP